MKERRSNQIRRGSVAVFLGITAVLALLVLMMGLEQAASVSAAPTAADIYVDHNATGANNGSSWTDAYTSLQDALAAAGNGSLIRVAEGVYYPDEGAAVTDNDRSASFSLPDGVSVDGGYISGDSFPTSGHPTILSGDIDQDNQFAMNSYHVVSVIVPTSTVPTSTVYLSGVHIRDGNADGTAPDNRGGGIYIDNARFDATEIEISDNRSHGGSGVYGGAGIYAGNGATLSLNLSVVNRNNSDDGSGGGILCYECTEILIGLVEITHNLAQLGGGMAVNKSGDFKMDRAVIAANTAKGLTASGGGLFFVRNHGSRRIANTLIAGNFTEGTLIAGESVDTLGGGISISGHPDYSEGTQFINTTVVSNRAIAALDSESWGGGFFLDGEETTIVNSVIWDNVADFGDDLLNSGGGDVIPARTVTITKSLINACPGSDNMICSNLITHTDPQFVVPASPVEAPTDNGNYRLNLGSMAINAGNNVFLFDFDLDNDPRIAESVIDMGAYELNISSTCPPTTTTTLLVNHAASGANTGLSWADALPTVQDALTVSDYCDRIAEIWVAGGAYSPDQGALQGKGGNANESFQLANGVSIYGGFAGTEVALSQRDVIANVTVLSGDMGGDDVVDGNKIVTDTANINGDNSYHVVTGNGTNNTAVLDGFTITAGQANGQASANTHIGGGLFNDGGSPKLNTLSFMGNVAQDGGAMANINSSHPLLTNIYFRSNVASLWGGALYNEGSHPELTNAVISGNAALQGGAIFNNNSQPEFTNVTVSGNLASNNIAVSSASTGFSPLASLSTPLGGGMFNFNGSRPALVNSIFWNNHDSTGTGTGSATIYNVDLASYPSIDYSLIQSLAGVGSIGSNNIDTDPLFLTTVDPTTAPTSAGNLHLMAHSPAIDAGDNAANNINTDVDGNPRITDGNGDSKSVIDMGAYETPSGHQNLIFLPVIWK